MKDSYKTKQDLLQEIDSLRKRITELEQMGLERKQMAEALRESEEKYRDLVENINDIIYSLNKEGLVTYISPAIEHVLGYLPMALIGHPFSELIYPEDLPLVIRAFNNVQSGILKPSEYRIFNKSGDIRWMRSSSRPNYINGNVAGIKGIAVDITAQKLAAIAVAENELRYRSLFDNMSDGVDVYGAKDDGADFVFVDMNKAGQAICKVTREDIIGRSVKNVFPGIEAMGLFAVFQKVWQTGEPGYLPVSLYQDKRVLRWVENYVYKLPTGEIVAVYEDWTARKELEFQLLQSQKMESIGTLAGGIAHDINNILAVIIGNAELAVYEEEEKDRRKNIEEILLSGERMRRLVKQILTFTRKTAESFILFDVAPLVRESIKLARATIPTTIEIKRSIASDAGQVWGDPTQLQQVIVNLCTNARDAMLQNGGTLRIELKRVEFDHPASIPSWDIKPGSYLMLTVKDTGCGIDPSIKDRIFDPFFTTKEVGKGTGLGLSIVYGIIRNHGGAITVDSIPGEGTTFTVYLSVAKAIADEIAHSNTTVPCGTGHILLVDDEEMLASLLKSMLTRLGYEVTAMNNSKATLAEFRKHPDSFDAIITDMTMPEMTGLQMAQEVLAIRNDIPIILCTGHSDLVDEEKATKMGIRKFLMKPVHMSVLARAVKEVLDQESRITESTTAINYQTFF